MTDPVVQTLSLTRRFGDTTAVDSLAITAPRHCVYGFLGPNGAGKTTTIRILLGLLRPTSGAFRLFGQPGGDRRILRRVGALVEAPSLYPHLTGAENLRHACLLKDVPRADIARVLDIVGLGAAAPRLVKTYSLGMKQRLGLAQALLGQPDLIVLDEPTNGLDPAGILEMRHLLRDLPRLHGVTVFLSSHLLNEVEQIATVIAIVSRGRLLFEGPPANLRARRGPVLRIRVDRAEAAAALLARYDYEASVEPGGTLALAGYDPDIAPALNRLLVRNEFDVYTIAAAEPSLENMFLELTSPS